jgi:hypothetical protein
MILSLPEHHILVSDPLLAKPGDCDQIPASFDSVHIRRLRNCSEDEFNGDVSTSVNSATEVTLELWLRQSYHSVMVIRSLFFMALTLCTASAQQTGNQRTSSTDLRGVLSLPDGSKFKTTLYNLKVIGQLRTTKKLPYFILAGTTCTECDEKTSIYIHSPSDGPMKNEAEQRRFAYPGRETDYETGQPVYEAKMFIGDCLATHPNAVIWFERGIGDDKKWHSGVSVTEVKNDTLVVSQLHGQLPKLPEVQEAVQHGKCQELPGVDGPSEP